MSRRVAVLDALPTTVVPLVRRVIRCADDRGAAVYLVGGPVRDHLLGREVRDVDLVVERSGGRGAPELAQELRGSGVEVVTHARFGTARLSSSGGVVDLTTLRKEGYAHAGALPSVAPGSLEEDLHRRDFAVNALAMPLSHRARRGRPEIIDPEGGIADLAARRLRILHPRSFHDDPTRALRAARLAPRLGFELDAPSRRALAEAQAAGVFARVSGERLRREFEKVFDDVTLGLDPLRALGLAERWQVLRAIQPGLGVAARAKPALARLRAGLEAPPWPWGALRGWVPGFALWLAGVPARPRRLTLDRLAFRGRLADDLLGFPAWRARTTRSLGGVRSRSAVDRRLAGVGDEWLLALHAVAAPPVRRRIARYASEDRGRPTPLAGGDLTALGLSGPAVGRALARLRAAWLDGEVRTLAEARALARELAGA